MLLKVNHLRVVYEDGRAARGLLACVPGLSGLVKKDDFFNKHNEAGLNVLGSACLNALCSLEDLMPFCSMSLRDEIALVIIFTPVAGMIWMAERIEELKKAVSQEINKIMRKQP